MYYLLAEKHPRCILCREPLLKKHGLIQDGEGKAKRPLQVIGWFIGHTGPRCIWCHQQAWVDREFWTRTGSRDDTAGKWQADILGPFDVQAREMAKREYPDMPNVKRNTLD